MPAPELRFGACLVGALRQVWLLGIDDAIVELVAGEGLDGVDERFASRRPSGEARGQRDHEPRVVAAAGVELGGDPRVAAASVSLR